MNKHLTRLFTASSALALALVACGPQSAPVQPEANNNSMSVRAQELVQQYEQQGQTNVQVLDVGKGKKTSAAIAINLSYTNPADFSTKISKNGWEGKLRADVDQFRVYLLECDVFTALPTADVGNPPDLHGGNGCNYVHDGTVAKSAGFVSNQTFIFDNVDENTVDNTGELWRYFVAIAAESIAPLTNITDPVHGYMVGSPNDSMGPVALSSGGGDNGGVKVEPGYIIASGEDAALTITLNLQSDQGAFIDSDVNVTDGATSYQGTVGVGSPP